MKNFKITFLQKILLKWITERIVIQSEYHKSNIITYYKILYDATKNEFTEDNKYTLHSFLNDCHEEALKEKEN